MLLPCFWIANLKHNMGRNWQQSILESYCVSLFSLPEIVCEFEFVANNAFSKKKHWFL